MRVLSREPVRWLVNKFRETGSILDKKRKNKVYETNPHTLDELKQNIRTEINATERGGSVVTHEIRIREVPGSNPGADQPDCGFSWFSSVIKANAGLDFHYHDPFDHDSSNSYIIKLKSVNLTNETLTTQQ